MMGNFILQTAEREIISINAILKYKNFVISLLDKYSKNYQNTFTIMDLNLKGKNVLVTGSSSGMVMKLQRIFIKKAVM